MISLKNCSLLNTYLCIIMALSTWIFICQSSILSSYLRSERPDFINSLSEDISDEKRGEFFEGASACLIIRDDNKRLIEWLAYHYQVLPLRNLIVTSDPSAQSSPSKILDRWRQKMPDLKILEWTEKDYSYNKFQAEMVVNWIDDPEIRAVKLLINRQYAFYGHCASHFKRNGQTWVFIIDTDEYVVFNNIHDDDPTKVDEVSNILDLAEHGLNSEQSYGVSTGMTQDSGNIKRHAKKMKRDIDRPDFESLGLQALSLRQKLPHVGKMNIIGFIKSIGSDPLSPFNKNPCYIMPRLFMSAVDPKPSELAQLPREIDPMQFDTLRFYRHAQKGGFPWNTYGKSMIDVSRVTYDDLSPVRAHKASSSCLQEDPFEDVYYSESLLRVQHYIGPFEAYISKNDQRKPKDKYLVGSRINEGAVFDVQPWLEAFINNVGLENALYLLENR